MPADVLLARLERVSQSGVDRWRARCPAHDGKSQSLSIRETDDGRVLVHCFAGCDVTDVLAAVGLTVSKLFPARLGQHIASSRSGMPAREALALVDHEVLVATLIVADLLKDRRATTDQWQRLALCSSRISDARSMACPARVPKESHA